MNTIVAEASRQGVKSIPQTAYLLATAYHEVGAAFVPVVEAFWLSEAWRKANLRYYPYYGRGFVQLTWQTNYERAGRELGLGSDYFVKSPNKLLEVANSAKIIVRGCAQGWFTGKKLSDYITSSSTDYVNARRIVNGTDKAALIASYAVIFEQALRK